MKLTKNVSAERKESNVVVKRRRKSVRQEIYKLWQEEIEEKGFNKLTRLQQGLL